MGNPRPGFTELNKRVNGDIADGTLYKTGRAVYNISVHCAVTPPSRIVDAKTIDDYHLNKGWSGCGYHFVVNGDGVVFKGRDTDSTPAAVKDHNGGMIAICRTGGWNNEFDATRAQETAIRDLCALLVEQYSLPVESVRGHNEFMNVNKACPLMDMDKMRKEIYKKLM